jgi:exodeoxyribonuclease VII large subunit
VPVKADLNRQLDERGRRIEREVAVRLRREDERLADRDRRLRQALPGWVKRRARSLDERQVRLTSALARSLRSAERTLSERGARLRALSPEAVLARGYSITMDARGHVLKAASDTAPGDRIRVRLASGRLGALVEQAE